MMARRRDGPLTSNDISLPQDFRHLQHVGVNSSRDEIVDVMLPLPKASASRYQASPRNRYAQSPQKSASPVFVEGRSREVAVDVPNSSQESETCYEKPRHSNSSLESAKNAAPRSPRMGVNSKASKKPSSSEETPIFASDYHARNARNIQMGLDGVLYQNVPEASFGPYNNINALGIEAQKAQPPPLPPKKEKKWTMQQDEVIVVLREGPDSFDMEPVPQKGREPSVQINIQPAKIRPPSVAQNMERPGFLGMGMGLGMGMTLGLGLDDPIPIDTPPNSYTPHAPPTQEFTLPAPPPQSAKPTVLTRSLSSEPPPQNAPIYEPTQTQRKNMKSWTKGFLGSQKKKREKALTVWNNEQILDETPSLPVAAPRTSTKTTPAPLPPSLPDIPKKVPPPRPPPPAQSLKPNLISKKNVERQAEEPAAVRVRAPAPAPAPAPVPAAVRAPLAKETVPIGPASAQIDQKPRGVYTKRSEIKLQRVRSLQDDFGGHADDDEEFSDEDFYANHQQHSRNLQEPAGGGEHLIEPDEAPSFPIPAPARPLYLAERTQLQDKTIKQLQEQLSIRKDRQKSHDAELKQIAAELPSFDDEERDEDEETLISQPPGQYSNPLPLPGARVSPGVVHRSRSSQSNSSITLGPPPELPFPGPMQKASPGHSSEMHILTELDDMLETYEEEHQGNQVVTTGSSIYNSDMQYIHHATRKETTEISQKEINPIVDPIMQQVFNNSKINAPTVENFDLLKQVGEYPAGAIGENVSDDEKQKLAPQSSKKTEKKKEAQSQRKSSPNDYALYLNVNNDEQRETQEPKVQSLDKRPLMKPIPKPRRTRAPEIQETPSQSIPFSNLEDSTKPFTIRL
ncbi:unnamed protein product, partial [Mesorhabditis belari]|uniref:CRIB domain-containing protein n=1 Tax=Mesorhabditis belari TaxID=2138241 RepID=A0AAF3EB65_9BILA